MYRVSKTVISKAKYSQLFSYLQDNSALATALYNAALFRIRQNFTARGKDILTANEQSVRDEISLTVKTYPLQMPKSMLSYLFLEKMMRVNANPDFFAGLPMQSSQAILKNAVHDFKSWLSALKAYKQRPSDFLGKPKMPGYLKYGKLKTFSYTNQDCIIKTTDIGKILKFPKTKCVLRLSDMPDTAILKEVQVKPYYGNFLVICIYEMPDSNETKQMPFAAGIDLGVDNIAALTSNNGLCVLYKGGALKSVNQWYNKQTTKLKSIAMMGHNSTEALKLGLLNTAGMKRLAMNRNQFLLDAFHKISSDIIMQCIHNRIGTLVIGTNKLWKQDSNIGHVNNQNFVQMPLETLRWMIQYKAERAGIQVIRQEESYTSKADLTANDEIPVYGSETCTPVFSGKRKARGLYRTGNGTIINADLNGAGNILRKSIPDAFENIRNFDFLQHINVVRYPDINKRIPFKGIAA